MIGETSVGRGDDFYFYYLKCNLCNSVEMFPGPRKDAVSWSEFAMLLKRSPEGFNHYRHCETCRKMTQSILIAFDSEDR